VPIAEDATHKRAYFYGVAGANEKQPHNKMNDLSPIESISPGESGAASIVPAAFAELFRQTEPKTILLVEDETFVLKIAAEVLEAAGYRVVSAKNAIDALAAYRRSAYPIDLLLTDVIMPGMSGRELAANLAIQNPHLRVLLMSGYAEQLATCESQNERIACIAKPFSIVELLDKIHNALNPVSEASPRIV
jgi:two-component system, cell cycle sensor histidine kinase and response regulator CckA